MRNYFWLILFTLVSIFILPSSALAANAGTWSDPAGDSVYPHADIKTTIVNYTDQDTVGIGIGTQLMIGGNRLNVYVDTDLNANTGWLGADVAFFYERYIQGQSLTTWVWNGSSWTLVAPQTVAYEADRYSFALDIARAELGATQGVRVFSRGGNANVYGGGNSFSDWAPNSGSYVLDFGLNTQVGGENSPVVNEVTEPPVIVPAPVAMLNLAEARNTSARGVKRKFGPKVKPIISKKCIMINSVSRRCMANFAKGRFIYKGNMVVREYVSNNMIKKSYIFTGYQTKLGCKKCKKHLRFTGIL